jgi:hypothetical protein
MKVEEAIGILEGKGATVSREDGDYYYTVTYYDSSLGVWEEEEFTDDEVIALCEEYYM